MVLDCQRDRAGPGGASEACSLGLRGSRSMERHILFFNFNVCFLVNTGRLQEIAWTLKPDIAVLTGTRIRLQQDAATRYIVWLDTLLCTMLGDVAATQIVQWVSGILLGTRFRPRMMKEVSFPPTSLAGRGGAMRLKGGAMDPGLSRRTTRLLWVDAVVLDGQLMDWVRTCLSSWPKKSVHACSWGPELWRGQVSR